MVACGSELTPWRLGYDGRQAMPSRSKGHDYAAAAAQAPWLLLIETDYVWMQPLQAPRAEDASAASLAFHFDYIRPSAPNLDKVCPRPAAAAAACETHPILQAASLTR